MKKFLAIFLLLSLTACETNTAKLPTGFELVATDGRTHFMFIEEYQLGDRVAQREAGRIICTEIYNHSDYCEIFMWKVREDIPQKLPVINRKTIIGKYEMKNDRVNLKPLMKETYDLPIYNTNQYND